MEFIIEIYFPSEYYLQITFIFYYVIFHLYFIWTNLFILDPSFYFTNVHKLFKNCLLHSTIYVTLLKTNSTLRLIFSTKIPIHTVLNSSRSNTPRHLKMFHPTRKKKTKIGYGSLSFHQGITTTQETELNSCDRSENNLHRRVRNET